MSFLLFSSSYNSQGANTVCFFGGFLIKFRLRPVTKEKERLLTLAGGFSGKKIAVWGDFILDEYLYGTTRRISREAPVLILSYKTKTFSFGGAGNSVLNIHALGGRPIPVGVIGQDAAGEKILDILKRKGISTASLIVEKGYPTPIKTRILAGEETTRKQQILRIDKEGHVPDTKGVAHALQKQIKGAQEHADALLISDYNYFTVKEEVFKHVLPGLKKKKIPVTLDSRFRLLRFKGVTISTPNEPEVEFSLQTELGEDKTVFKQAGETLLHRTEASAVLITRGSRGMALFERHKPLFPIPVHGTTDIVDVTGAGDTVISVLTLALACRASFREAAMLANFAGSVVVMKKGTATLSPKELKEAILS